MAEELTQSLAMLARRGVPRGATQVLEEARRGSVRRRDGLVVGPRMRFRAAWVAAAAFTATLVVIGGSVALSIAIDRPGLDAGSFFEAVDEVGTTAPGGWLPVVLIAAAAAIVAVVVSRQRVRRDKEDEMTTTLEKPHRGQEKPPKRGPYWLMVAVLVLVGAVVAAWWFGARDGGSPSTAQQSTTTTGADAVAVVERMYQAWADNDVDAYRALYAPDAVLVWADLEPDPMFAAVDWMIDDFDGDGAATPFDDDQFWMAFDSITGTETVSLDCERTAIGRVECAHTWIDAVMRVNDIAPVTVERVFVIDGDRIVEQRTLALAREAEERQYDHLRAFQTYETWVRLNHTENYDELFRDPFQSVNLIYSPAALELHEELMAEYLSRY